MIASSSLLAGWPHRLAFPALILHIYNLPWPGGQVFGGVFGRFLGGDLPKWAGLYRAEQLLLPTLGRILERGSQSPGLGEGGLTLPMLPTSWPGILLQRKTLACIFQNRSVGRTTLRLRSFCVFWGYKVGNECDL